MDGLFSRDELLFILDEDFRVDGSRSADLDLSCL
jgi:hypothetical protein